MNQHEHFATAAVPHFAHCRAERHNGEQARRLREEIAAIEARLLISEARVNSAYERALVRAYEALLESRRQQLATL